MRFDPALAAQESFRLALGTGELGNESEAAIEAEETFSAGVGQEATAAYENLHQIGERNPRARAFQEFLMYITWQQVTEETIPGHFQKGLELCDRYLSLWKNETAPRVIQIRELRQSFRAGLGMVDEEDDEYDQDTFKGGD
jgi:hypothetical protein